MGEIVPVITEGYGILVQEFPPVFFAGLLVSPGNLPANLFLVLHV
jgi:hypothetical protein